VGSESRYKRTAYNSVTHPLLVHLGTPAVERTANRIAVGIVHPVAAAQLLHIRRPAAVLHAVRLPVREREVSAAVTRAAAYLAGSLGTVLAVDPGIRGVDVTIAKVYTRVA